MRRLGWLAALVLSAAARGQEAPAPVPKVHYVLDATSAAEKSVKVEMTVSNAPDGDLTVALPYWRPGSYRAQDYHTRLKDLSAAGPDGAKLQLEAVDERTWTVKGPTRRGVTLRYTLTPRDIGPKHCFLEGPGTWLYLARHKDAACTVRFVLPAGWKQGSGLSDLGDGIFGARDYDTFADCPIELGPFEEHSFEQDGVRYELVVRTPGRWDSAGLIAAIKRIVREQNRMFGGAPFDRYVFLYRWIEGARGGGGLEHLNSTDIGLPYQAMQIDGSIAASITSHEYFHLWNVKRIRPAELGPFDYTQPVRSVHLWLCEGVTSYFGDLTLARTRIWDEDQYFRHLATEAEILQSNPLRLKLSVEEASRTVWDRRPGEPSLDYYNKGELLGWLLDLKIRTMTKNAKSMDDVMRLMYQRYVVEPSKAGKGPIGVGFPRDGILKALNEVSGGDFSDFYKRYISGTEELPYEEVCAAAGLKFDFIRRMGFASAVRNMRVVNVPAGSDDEKAGLKPGDRIVAVGGQTLSARADLARALASVAEGTEVEVKVQRAGADEPVELKLKAVRGDQVSVSVKRREDATAEQKKLVDSWLKKGDY